MLRVIKIGGNIVDNPARLSAFLRDFAALEGPKILVHGGGKIATSISAALGIETVMVEGRRVTDEATLRVVTMVYNGINKQIVSELQRIGCDAVGLCGADGRLVISRRRPPVRLRAAATAGCAETLAATTGAVGEKAEDPSVADSTTPSACGTHPAPDGGRTVDYGFVGDPVEVNVGIVDKVINNGLALVVAPITLDIDGGLLNTNADTVASVLAVAMANSTTPSACGVHPSSSKREVELVYCFERQGVMADVDDPGSVIERIDRRKFEELKAAGIVDKGMIPKLENALSAVDRGVARVVICAAENLSKPGYGGTSIVER